MTKIALLQMNSAIDPEANLEVVLGAAEDAADNGAEILFTPEMSILLDKDRKRAGEWIESDKSRYVVNKLTQHAAAYGIDIALGSMPVQGDGERWANRSMYFSGTSSCNSQPVIYDKIHMFDVELSTGESWRESNAYQPGQFVVSINDTPIGKLGQAICYDMRFPALFEALGNRKCDAIAIPAAFTKPTGAAHWHILLRARAIEASAFIIAAAQVGKHQDGRETYGHSLVIDPWGDVLLDMGGTGPGLGFCEIDLGRIDEVRSQIPSLANRRKIPE